MKPAVSPVSLKIDVSRLAAKGVVVKLEADDAQRAALAAAHGLQAVGDFRFELRVSPWKKEGAQVTGRVSAAITQSCVVSLDPVEAVIDEEVSSVFVPENSRLAPTNTLDGEILLDSEGADAPEIFSGSRIDVGALAEEFFELAIDPYPRREGVELPEAPRDDKGEEKAEPAFAKLGSLVRKR